MVIEGVEEINSQMRQITSFTQDQININEEVNKDTITVRTRANEIRLATEEQKIGILEIVNSISAMNSLIQNNAVGAKDMTSNIEIIREMSVELEEKVKYFKLLQEDEI